MWFLFFSPGFCFQLLSDSVPDGRHCSLPTVPAARTVADFRRLLAIHAGHVKKERAFILVLFYVFILNKPPDILLRISGGYLLYEGWLLVFFGVFCCIFRKRLSLWIANFSYGLNKNRCGRITNKIYLHFNGFLIILSKNLSSNSSILPCVIKSFWQINLLFILGK